MKQNSSDKSFDDKIENLKRNYNAIVGKTNSVEEGESLKSRKIVRNI